MDQGILAPIFFAMIGSWGRAVIGWALENPEPVGALFAIWLLLFGTSKWQLKRIENQTSKLTLKEAEKALKSNPEITIKEFYRSLKPTWDEMVKSSAWFIPHRWELWPVPATPTRVVQRIDFTPEWLGEFLWLEQIEMRGAEPRENPPPESPLQKIQKGYK